MIGKTLLQIGPKIGRNLGDLRSNSEQLTIPRKTCRGKILNRVCFCAREDPHTGNVFLGHCWSLERFSPGQMGPGARETKILDVVGARGAPKSEN